MWNHVFVPKEEIKILRIKMAWSRGRIQELDLLGEVWWLLKYRETAGPGGGYIEEGEIS